MKTETVLVLGVVAIAAFFILKRDDLAAQGSTSSAPPPAPPRGGPPNTSADQELVRELLDKGPGVIREIVNVFDSFDDD